MYVDKERKLGRKNTKTGKTQSHLRREFMYDAKPREARNLAVVLTSCF